MTPVGKKWVFCVVLPPPQTLAEVVTDTSDGNQVPKFISSDLVVSDAYNVLRSMKQKTQLMYIMKNVIEQEVRPGAF